MHSFLSLYLSSVPVSYAFRPFQDVLPGKGEWFKRNNLFFRETVGVYSDRYDLCVKVADKRAIARSVVQAVYDNGGRFLDAEGQEVDIRRSMDKAMKAVSHESCRHRLRVSTTCKKISSLDITHS
jgi:hypothetical protein